MMALIDRIRSFAASKLQIYLTLLRGKWVDFYRKESNTQGNRLYSTNSKLKRKSSKYVFRYCNCEVKFVYQEVSLHFVMSNYLYPK